MEQSNTEVPNSPPPVNNLPPSPQLKTKSQSNSPLILGGIILLSLFTLGGVILGKYLFAPQFTVIQPTLAPKPTLIPTTTPDPIANWKTYTNNKVGISFKYPAAWTEKGPVAENDTTMVYAYSDEKFGEDPEPLQYYLWVTEAKKLPKQDYTRESIGKYTAYKTDQEPSRSGALTYFITKDENRYIQISLTPFNAGKPFPSQDQYIKTLNQILSTFKFLDQSQTDETVNWKTYKDPNNLLTFEYPPNWIYEKFDISGRTEHHGLIKLKPETYKPDVGMTPLFIQYWDNPEGLTIEQYDKKINQGAAMLYPLNDTQAQMITVGNVTAYYNSKGDCSPFACHKYVILINNKIWEVGSQYMNNPNEFKQTIDQILSTFQFLD